MKENILSDVLKYKQKEGRNKERRKGRERGRERKKSTPEDAVVRNDEGVLLN